MSGWEDEMIPLAPEPAPQGSTPTAGATPTVVNAPPTMTFDDMLAAQRAAETPSAAGAALIGAQQGATLGSADEMAARAASVGTRLEGSTPAYGRGLPPNVRPEQVAKAKEIEQRVLAEQRRKLALAQAVHPYATMGGMAAGGAIPALATMGAAAPATVLGGMAAAGAEGAIQGGMTGYGMSESDDPLTVAREVGENALVGGAGGAILSPIAKAVPAAYRAARNAMSPRILSKAAQREADQFFQNPAGNQALRDRMTELGPEAMLADVSEPMLHVARAGKSNPVVGDEVVRALAERDARAAPRIRQGLDESLGPTPDLVGERGAVRQNMRDMGPEYRQLLGNAPHVDPTGIAENLEREIADSVGKTRSSLQTVRESLNIDGRLDSSASKLHAVHGEIGDMIEEAVDKGRTNEARILGEVRRQIGDHLEEAVPGMRDLNRRYAQEGRTMDVLGKDDTKRFGRADEIMQGGNNSMPPLDLRRELADAAVPLAEGQMGPDNSVRAAMQKVVRAKVDRDLGNAPNDQVALARVMKGESDWPQQKLEEIFGPARAGQARDVLDQATTFRNTRNRVLSGSDTANTIDIAGRMGEIAKSGQMGDVKALSLTGMAASLPAKIWNGLASNSGEHMATEFVRDMTRLAVATGQQRDQLLQSLMQRAIRVNAPTETFDAVMQAAARGGATAAAVPATNLADDLLATSRAGR